MRLQRFASGTSLAVLATMLAAQPVRAAAYLGNPTTTLGNVTYNRATPSVDTITVDSAQATINWVPTDAGIGGGAINFLPNGATANYVAGPNAAAGYTVLNRILAADPSREINFDGMVNSAAGGAVWFYAPGGILLGANARFNVGSLLLSANDPVTDAGGLFIQPGNRFGVAGIADSEARVAISSTAQVNALNEGSYVIAVAPKISQDGAIRVNGSAALVAAEAVDFTYNGGLFDITVSRGTQAGLGPSGRFPLVHDGSTGGPASTGGTDYHRIYLVAVPKNDAITLFLGGPNNKIGFDVAGAADVVGNAIVLSGGRNVVATASGDPFAASPVNATVANVHLNDGDYTSQVKARSNGDTFASSLNGDTFFRSNVDLRGVANAHINARNGHTITVAGNAMLSTVADSTLMAGASRTGGRSLITAGTGSTVTISGSALVDARGIGDGNNTGAGSSGDGTGGLATIDANGGVIGVGGTATVDARGLATGATSVGTDGGTGTGGQAQIDAVASGAVQIGGLAFVQASGQGGVNRGGGDLIGGTGTGGAARVFVASGGTLMLSGGLTSQTFGTGGSAVEGIRGGIGNGGSINFSAGPGTLTVNGALTLTNFGVGGNGTAGGDGVGGFLDAYTVGGTINVAGGSASVTAGGIGGSGNPTTGTGGTGTGGTAQVSAYQGQFIVSATGVFEVSAQASGGTGANGGNAVGGLALVRATDGLFRSFGNVLIQDTAVAASGSNGNGGSAFGNIGASGGNSIPGSPSGSARAEATSAAGTLDFRGSLQIFSYAFGGAGSGGGDGGSATSSFAALRADGGNVTVGGAVAMNSNAFGGNGVIGGTATAANHEIFVRAATLATGTFSALANATGGNGSRGAGGAATGGSPNLVISSSLTANSVLTANSIVLQGNATGGNGGDGAIGHGGDGGAAISGSPGAVATSYSGFLTTPSLFVQSLATGGAGGAGGSAANGTGGAGGAGGAATSLGFTSNGSTSQGAGNTATNGVITITAVNLDSTANGGAGGAGGSGAAGGAGGGGGAALGGGAGYLARGGTQTLGSLSLTAGAVGGAGGGGSGGAAAGIGGDATGGYAALTATPHFYIPAATNVTLGSVYAYANGTGGASAGTGGSGTGGSAVFQLARQGAPAPQPASTGSLTSTGGVTLIAVGTGGASGTGTGGAGTGGTAMIAETGGALRIDGRATGTADGNGGASSGGNGGAARGGTAGLQFDGGTVALNATSGYAVQLHARALGGSAAAGTGGVASGGTTSIDGGVSRGGALTAQHYTLLSAHADGGAGQIGGDATGGTGMVALGSGSSYVETGLDRTTTFFEIDAYGYGGGGGAGSGGAGLGGSSAASVTGGALLSVGDLYLRTTGTGGTATLAGTGGFSRAGTSTLIADGTGSQVDIRYLGRVSAFAFGGEADAVAGTGGAGQGGTSLVAARNGGRIRQLDNSFATIKLRQNSYGSGGGGASGGAGLGGSATLEVSGAGVILAVGGAELAATGTGGGGSAGDGGAATGGIARVFAQSDGTTTIDQALLIDAGADAGDGAGAGSTGGAATGGSALALAQGGALNLSGTAIDAHATGGRGARGAAATGGTAQAIVVAGTLAATGTATLDASGLGGSGLAGFGGAGGDGIGGRSDFSLNGQTGASIVGAAVDQDVRGIGGTGGSGGMGITGGNGGGGFGGVAQSGSASAAGSLAVGALEQLATAIGGTGGAGGTGAAGGRGGNATGGSGGIGSAFAAGTQTGNFVWASVNSNVSATGGAGGAGNGAAGGDGGDGLGGGIGVQIYGGVATINGTASFIADGTGGVGGSGSVAGVGGAGFGGGAGAGTHPSGVPGGASSLTGNALTLGASGFAGGGSVAGVASHGTVVLFSDGGTTRFTSALMVATGAGEQTGVTPSGVAARAGNLEISGNLTLGADGDAGLGADGGGNLIVGGTLDFSAGSIIDTLNFSPPQTPGTVSAQTLLLSSASDIDILSNLSTPNALSLFAPGSLSTGNLTGGSVDVSTGLGDINVGSVISASTLKILSPGTITTGNIRGEDDVYLNGSTGLAAGNISAADTVFAVTALGNIVTGNLDAGIVAPSTDPTARYGIILSTGNGDVTTGTLNAIGAAGLVARGGSVDAGSISALDIGLLADNSVASGALTTPVTGTIVIGDGGLASLLSSDGNLNIDYSLLLAATPTPLGGAITIDGAVTTGTFKSASLGALTINGALGLSGSLYVNAGALSLGDLSVPGTIELSTPGDLTVGNIVGDSFVGLTSGNVLTVGNIDGQDDIELTAVNGITAGRINAADSVFVTTASGDIVTGALDAGLFLHSDDPAARYGVLVSTGNGNVTTGDIGVFGAAGLVATGGSIVAGNMFAGLDIGLLASGSVDTGRIGTAPGRTIVIGDASLSDLLGDDGFGNVDYSALLTATPVALGGTITIGGNVTTGNFRAASIGALTVTGPMVLDGGLLIDAGAITLADLTVPGVIDLSTPGRLITGNVIGGDYIALTSGDALTVGNVRGEDDIELTAASAITTGNVSAADSVFVTAGGAVVTGLLDAGVVAPSTDPSARYGILVDATGNATVGGLRAIGAAGIVARSGAVQVGASDVGLSLGLLARTGVRTGSIRTGSTGTTLIAADSMAALVVTDQARNPDYSALLTATPVRLGGPITVGGAVLTGLLKTASSGGTAFAGPVAAGTSVAIDSGGLAAFAGAVTAPQIAVRSADIDIGQGGALGSTATATLALTVDPAATAITLGGSGSQQGGWKLDNAEAGRLRSRSISVTALGTPNQGTPAPVTIDTLALRGGLDQSGNSVSVLTPGAIRVVGAVAMTNAASGDSLKLTAGTRLEVVTDRGALRVSDGGGAPGGQLELTAPDIWVADAALLGRLAADPAFSGRDAALAQPSAEPSLAGPVVANRIIVHTGGRFLVQNSGSNVQRAAFTAGPGGLQIIGDEGRTPEVIINGRADDGLGGYATNADTRTKVVFTGAFSVGSTVNGCTVTGTCTIFDTGTTDVVAEIATQIADLEAQQEERDEAAEPVNTTPGVRLARLIDLSAVTGDGSISEPVTSGGNPALWLDAPPPAPAPGVEP